MNITSSNKVINNLNIINHNLSKYNKQKEKYYIYKIRNLMFHKKSHFTSIFTEYLIWDDNQEFLFDFYPYKYSHKNIPIFIKFQYYSNYLPILREQTSRAIIFKNMKKKRRLLTFLSEKTKQSTYNSKIILKKYSNILPKNLTDNSNSNSKTIKENKNENNNISESTIDNVNANNDISMSLDFKINKKYDNQILNQNIGFVKGKNGKNDIELLNMMNYLKPINTSNIYQNKKSKIRNKFIYLEYINNKLKSKSKEHKNKNNEKEILIKNKNEIIDKNKNNSLKNKYKNIKRNNKREYFVIKTKKENKLNNNIILINKYNDLNDKTVSTKTNSYNKSFKRKSRNSQKFLNDENKYSELISNILFNSEKRIITSYNSKNKLKENKENITTCSSKYISRNQNKNQNKKIIISKSKPYLKKINFKNSKEKYDYENKNKKSKTNNIKNGISRFTEISPENKKSKLLIIYKNDNILKKEKSLENKNINLSNKLLYNQFSQKKNKNIIIVKNKIVHNINLFN